MYSTISCQHIYHNYCIEKTIESNLRADDKKLFYDYAEEEFNNFIQFECPQCLLNFNFQLLILEYHFE
jgi:hypothetical protein